MLVEKKRTAKWLTEELGKNPFTVSNWCTNVSQYNHVFFRQDIDTAVVFVYLLGI